MRLEGYEVIEEWPDNTWLARDADGSLVELVASVVREGERGEATQRLTRLRKLAHPTLPRIIAIEGDPAVRGELIVVTEHRPRVTLARCATASEVGLAVALVCTFACATARTLADLHAARIVHGRVRPACIGMTLDGAAALDLPRLVRTRDARHDVDDLVHAMCTLIAPPTDVVQQHEHDEIETESDFDDTDEYAQELDAAVPPAPSPSPIENLIATRPDVPPELIDLMRATQGDEPLDARGFAETLARDLPWTQWTAHNVVDEVRALLPDLTS